jgi:broad specificity phosphatase PhoE
MTLYFVRHGESTWNVAKRIQGQTASPELTARGIVQAEAAAEELAGAGVRRIVASDLLRARQTAEVIAARLGLEIEWSPLLRERHWGVFQGGPSAVAVAVEAELPPHEPVDGGESRHDLRDRVRELLAQLDDRPTALVSHGGLIREALVVVGLGGPDDPVGNGAVHAVPWPAPLSGEQITGGQA